MKIVKDAEVVKEYDVLVAGGGVAGVAAAVSASRMGKSTLLIEKSITLGGLATIGLVNWFVPMCNGRGTKIIRGLAEEMYNLSAKLGFDTIPDEWKNGNEPVGKASTRWTNRFSIPIYIMQLTKWLKDENVDILFDTIVSDVVMEDDVCKGLIVENKSGTQIYLGKVIIDATGDADVLFRAGIPTVQGKNYHTFYCNKIDTESCHTAIDKGIERAYKKVFGGEADLYGNRHPENKEFWLGTNVNDVTNYVIENHLEVLEKIKNDDKDKRDIVQIPTMPQFRTTRRIEGEYTLTTKDVYKHFEDSISAMNDFEHRHFLYEIPYRVMVNRKSANIIAAGRITSGDGYGWDLLRVIPPAIITGQAAGVAASVCIDDGNKVCNVDIKKLQNELKKQNVIIHFDDKLVKRELANDEDANFEKYEHI